MKSYIIKFLLVISVILIESCDDKLDVPPQGAFAFEGLGGDKGVDGLLISAYSGLDGWFGWGVAAPWAVGVSNWIYGDVASDDGAKGGGFGDQGDINLIEQYKWNAAMPMFNEKWIAVYEGVARSNDAINGIRSSALSDTDKNLREGEARFLRAFFHFEAKKIWGRVYFVDEAVTDFRLSNDGDIWPNIEADLVFAVDNLPVDQAQVGRATKGAAQALLAKVHMFQNDFTAAKPLLENLLANSKYGLSANFEDNFRMASENGKESIFAYQSAANDGTRDADHASLNANWGDILAHPSFAPYNSPGMHQPSYNLVNAFKTDINGLPLFDTYNDTDINNEVTNAGPEYPGNLDPRLDFSVGRVGIPFLGFGNHPGIVGINGENFYGPYNNKKNCFNKVEQDQGLNGGGWVAGPSALNYNIIRFADVILWSAEVAVSENRLEDARLLVNRIRNRAKTGKMLTEEDAITPAANYVIGEYPAGHEAFTSAALAKRAVQFERRLELAMEGHRFFDLVRWGNAATVLNDYLAVEKLRRPDLLNNASPFKAGLNEYFPIPFYQIEASKNKEEFTLTQTEGY